jgi:hypothetical protein
MIWPEQECNSLHKPHHATVTTLRIRKLRNEQDYGVKALSDIVAGSNKFQECVCSINFMRLVQGTI